MLVIPSITSNYPSVSLVILLVILLMLPDDIARRYYENLEEVPRTYKREPWE